MRLCRPRQKLLSVQTDVGVITKHKVEPLKERKEKRIKVNIELKKERKKERKKILI